MARVCVAGICIWLCPITVNAAPEDDPAVESGTTPADAIGEMQPWQPPPPAPDDSDWIQLGSGEWLKGEFKRLYKQKLEFDSDELGLQELDWEDVKQVHGSSNRKFSVLFEGQFTVEGFLQVSGGKVFLTVEQGQVEFPRDRLVAIVPGAVREIDYWTAKITFGVTFTRGNTKQTQWQTISNIKRRTVKTRLMVDWLGNFSETEGVETVNNQRLNYKFDVFRTRKLFLRPIFGEFFRDPFSNVKFRYTVGTGLGYDIIDTAKTEWTVSGGPAYRKTRFESVQAGQNDSESTPALEIETRFEIELTRRLDFSLRYSFQIVNEESGTYTHNLVTGFSTELTRWLDLDFTFVWDRIQDPQPASDGTVPERDDFYYTIGLGIEF